jgi:hypothetical protein
MHVLKERYVKKCAKDICGSELYTLVVSFCSKHNIFFKNNYKIGSLIVNRGEGLEAGGVAKLCYCSLSPDNTGASKSI